MISSFEQGRLYELLQDFYTVVGIRISIFDDQFNMVTEYPSYAPRICTMVRSSETGLNACKTCDREACMRAKKMREPHVYTCHAGILEAITPIRLGGGVIGYAIFAHMMPEEDYETSIAEVCRRCLKYGYEESEIRQAAEQMERYSQKKILASMRLLDAIAAYLQISNLAVWKNEDISKQIDSFIESNLTEKLSSTIICRHFFLSRTKLYQISIEAFGMGISQYVTFKRIEKAKELMHDKDLTITAIAGKVGIDDYNYFCKLFQKIVGLSPGKFRAEL